MLKTTIPLYVIALLPHKQQLMSIVVFLNVTFNTAFSNVKISTYYMVYLLLFLFKICSDVQG